MKIKSLALVCMLAITGMLMLAFTGEQHITTASTTVPSDTYDIREDGTVLMKSNGNEALFFLKEYVSLLPALTSGEWKNYYSSDISNVEYSGDCWVTFVDIVSGFTFSQCSKANAQPHETCTLTVTYINGDTDIWTFFCAKTGSEMGQTYWDRSGTLHVWSPSTQEYIGSPASGDVYQRTGSSLSIQFIDSCWEDQVDHYECIDDPNEIDCRFTMERFTSTVGLQQKRVADCGTDLGLYPL